MEGSIGQSLTLTVGQCFQIDLFPQVRSRIHGLCQRLATNRQLDQRRKAQTGQQAPRDVVGDFNQHEPIVVGRRR